MFNDNQYSYYFCIYSNLLHPILPFIFPRLHNKHNMGQCSGKIISSHNADNGFKKDAYQEIHVKKHVKTERFHRYHDDDMSRQKIQLESIDNK